MKKTLFHWLLLFFLPAIQTFGQQSTQVGEVTFLTSQSVYVRFENTELIQVGDTLRLENSQSPCLIVRNKSSNSVVTQVTNGCEVSRGLKVVHIPSITSTETQNEPEITQETLETEPQANEEIVDNNNLQRISGRVSASSYSNLASDREDRHRIMSRFSLKADHINNSRFSFETYLNYRKVLTPEGGIVGGRDSFLRLYNFAIRYDKDQDLSLILGRRINPRMSSVGAIDGIQAEKRFGKNYVGAIAGFRPDIRDFGFNSSLLQYGAYVGRESREKNYFGQSTLGIIEQRNGAAVDRRYAYLQHSSTISRNLSLFASSELDLFNNVTNDIRLTNLYLSARYRINRNVNFMVSFDSRKRIIYYETFETEVERLLNDDLARQGIRARVNVKPVKNVQLGASISKRFQSDSQNESTNLYGYLTITKIPSLGGRLNVAYNVNSSNYLNSNIISVRHSRALIDHKLFADIYYRSVQYEYGTENNFTQTYTGAGFDYNINRKFTLSLMGELGKFREENNIRVFTKISRRF